MKAYTIHKFYECKLTGNVLAEVSFALNEGLKTFLHPFTNINNAKSYIEKEKRTWFLSAMEKYVHHKKHIIETGNHTPQFEALRICLQALAEYENKSTENACKLFMKGFKYFDAILPATTNSSHLTSAENLKELQLFCEMTLNQQL